MRSVKPHGGFTLIELVTVIVVLGVVSVGLGGFVRNGMQIYTDATERDQLLSASRFVVERVNRELRMAIPNSMRVKTDTTNGIQCLEFVPAQWVSYYTSMQVLEDKTVTARVVEFANNSANFNLQPNDLAFVYPKTDTDVYGNNSQQRRTILSCTNSIDADGDDQMDGTGNCNSDASSSNIAQLSLSGGFTEGSPASRIYFGRRAVSYCVGKGEIHRYENSIEEDQQVYPAASGLMGEHVANDMTQSNQWPFQIHQATLEHNGLVQVLLAFEHNEEQLNYSFEVQVPNVP